MSHHRYAAIDQGTTGTRLVVFDEQGRHTSTGAITHQQITPQPGWVEHNPVEILNNIRASLAQIDKPDAVGLAHQGESLIAWDAKTGEPVYNAIVWQDQRTADTIKAMKAAGLEPEVKARSGLPLDCYFSASKMGWIMKHVPAATALARQGRLRMGTMDAFFMFRLCGGVHVTDYNSASRTSLFNIHTLRWDEELCRLFGVPCQVLPDIRHNIGHFGDITLRDGIAPLTACMVDQFAGTYGHGCQRPGEMKITFGTGAFLQAITGTTPPADEDSGLLPTLCWKFPGQQPVFGLDGGVYNAASALNWGQKMGLFSDISELDNLPAEPAITRGVAFVPALSGLGCPHWDRSATGLWAGLSLDTTRTDMIQSILEGVAVRTAEVVHAMEKCVPVGDQIAIDGGLAGSDYFRQFLATLLQKEIVTPSHHEMTAQGIALLARKGLGIDTRWQPAHAGCRVCPQARDYTALYHKYQSVIQRSRGLRE